MALLKEDGSLNIEWINKLPLEENLKTYENLTREKKDEYWAKQPINESNRGTRAVMVDYTLEDDLKRGAVIATDFINKLREKHGMKI